MNTEYINGEVDCSTSSFIKPGINSIETLSLNSKHLQL
jgi:hypothetical protein